MFMYYKLIWEYSIKIWKGWIVHIIAFRIYNLIQIYKDEDFENYFSKSGSKSDLGIFHENCIIWWSFPVKST